MLVNQVADSYLNGYGGYSKGIIKMSSHLLTERNKIDTFDFFKYPVTRIFTRYGLGFMRWETNMRKLQAYLINQDNSSEINSKLKNHKGSSWDKNNISTINLFKTFVSDLSVEDKEFSIRYLHSLFTHYPVDFDEECRYKSDKQDWYGKAQTEDGIKDQNICAINLFLTFIDKLKSLGIYDNTLIVFKSDHGEPAPYFSKSPDNLRINGSKKWGYNRYRPTLMIKDYGVDNANVTYKSNLVLLNDLARTLCEKSNLDIKCENYPGINLIENSSEDMPYYIYVPKDYKSTHRYKDHISVKIPSRKISLLQAMKNSKLINLSDPDDVDVEKATSDFKTRLSDIENIKNALHKYFVKYKKYPISKGWDGICTKWGSSKQEYNKDLVPIYIESLPTDPRNSQYCDENYLYKSIQGLGYKFIVHESPKFDLKRVDSEMIDPKRPTSAYGIWTKRARNW